jgi:Tfp pilus assembly protein PilV
MDECASTARPAVPQGQEVMDMLRTMWTQLKREEDGMSVLEIVLAAFILFFVFTAMIGLVGATTEMGMNAKARVAMTNAVSSHMEWVRSLSFDEIAITGTTAEGIIEPTYTYEVDGFEITIQNQISTGADGKTREVAVTASAQAPGFTTVSMTSFAAVRGDGSFIAGEGGGEPGGGGSGDAPIVEFTTMTADEDAVVYGSYQLGGSPFHVEVDAESVNDGGVITDLRYYCAGELLRDGNTIYADVAEWQPGVSPASERFRWDTRQVNDDGEAVVEDGWRVVYVIAVDSTGAEGRAERRFYVDNHAPGAPGAVSALVQNSSETRVSWGIAQDGTDAAVKYEIALKQVDYDGSLLGAGSFITVDPAYIHLGSPFSRYTATVRAGSPRNLWGPSVSIASPYTTRPDAEGYSSTRYSGKNNKRQAWTDVVIHCSPPTFKTTSVQYDVYRGLDPTALSLHASNVGGPNFFEEIYKKVGRTGQPESYYYQFKVTYTAGGPGGGTSETVWSDVIGPTTGDTAPLPMGHVSW